MKQRTDVSELRKGMYVAELDRPWTGTPFMFAGFWIRTDDEIAKLRELCRFVFIDPENEYFLEGTESPAQPGVTAVAHEVRLAPAPPVPVVPGKVNYDDEAILEQEIEHAFAVEREARDLVTTMMNNVRLGKAIETPAAKACVHGMTDSVVRNPDALMWLTTLKNKHEYTALHSVRVTIYALALARHLGLPREEMELLGLGALLHDIGKLRLPAHILDKPGALSPTEIEIMKTHVADGLTILESIVDFPAAAMEPARFHHERFDGQGYPAGLAGAQISRFGHISAIVDNYDALTSDRSYQRGVSPYEALRLLYENRGKAFHPQMVEQFIQCVGIYPIGSIVEMSSGSVGVVITVNRRRRLKPRVVLVLQPDKRPLDRPAGVDLVEEQTSLADKSLEIRRVLPPGAYGINPTDYLPMTPSQAAGVAA